MLFSNERMQGAKRLELAAFPWVRFSFDRRFCRSAKDAPSAGRLFPSFGS
ncbi:hypothetical protein LAC80_32380 [Ensifer adhaerens]|nr:hypothetical protein [Ensifer adhaerens]UAY03338.1 hypothetical protein LAC80_32380 [Ensifer adhaerens]